MKYEIVITGYKGFIGSRLMWELKRRGYQVAGVEIGDMMPKCELCFHLGSLLQSSRTAMVNNRSITEQVVEQSDRIIFSSSAAVYGNARGEASYETDPLQPINIYGQSKVESEDIIRRAHPDKSIIFRFSNVWGFGNNKGVVEAFMEGRNIVYGENKTRDYVHVDDVVRILFESMYWDRERWGQAYNLSTGMGTQTGDLFHLINGWDADYEVYYLPDQLEIDYSVLDNHKLRGVTTAPLPITEFFKGR